MTGWSVVEGGKVNRRAKELVYRAALCSVRFDCFVWRFFVFRAFCFGLVFSPSDPLCGLVPFTFEGLRVWQSERDVSSISFLPTDTSAGLLIFDRAFAGRCWCFGRASTGWSNIEHGDAVGVVSCLPPPQCPWLCVGDVLPLRDVLDGVMQVAELREPARGGSPSRPPEKRARREVSCLCMI